MDTNIFKIPQGQVVALLGISLHEVRRRKKSLAEGADWVRDGNKVLFCDEGVKKMREGLSLAAVASPVPAVAIAEADLVSQKNAPPEMPFDEFFPPEQATKPVAAPRRVFLLPDAPPVPQSPEQVTELVVYKRTMNPQVLEAHRVGGDKNDRSQIVRVRVRDSANFLPGMKLGVRLIQLPDLFEFTGRLPRWVGKY